MPDTADVHQFFERIRSFVGLTDDDSALMQRAWPVVRPAVPAAIDDFYENIQLHPFTASVMTGGPQQVVRLKQTLAQWIESLFSGRYDRDFVESRWRVGRRHVEIGLPQSYAIGALARLRLAINQALLAAAAPGGDRCPAHCLTAVNKLLDIDAAIIEFAYQQHFARSLGEAAAEKMQQSERLASIGRMVTGLAHESRNALQRSGACLEALLLEIEDRPAALRQAVRIQAALDHLNVLYEEVRNYAAPIRLDTQPVDLVARVQGAWQMLRPLWQQGGITFSVAADPDGSRPVQADPHRLEQILTNLLQNAIQAVGPTGEIRCSIESRPDRVCVSVADSGTGVPEDVRAQIFDPFFTTKPKGTGLGLAITRRLVEAHGGTIRVTSSPLGGACFQFYLPTRGTT